MNTEMSKNIRTGASLLRFGRAVLLVALVQAVALAFNLHPTWLSIALTALVAMMIQSIGNGMVSRG